MTQASRSIYAEIGIDYSPATRAQKQLLTDATQTSLNIEKNFKNLGIKSAQEFDLMRKKIENSYAAIANSSKVSANDILRAEKAKNEEISRLNTQQYGSSMLSIDNLKKHWLAASAIIYGAVKVIGEAWDLAKIGADYEEQKGILDNLSTKYGTTADDIVAAMGTASDGLVAKSDLMTIALGGIAKGLNPEQLINLADAARILGDTVGKDATTALNDLSLALETGKTKALKGYLGTAIDLEATFGDLYESLTETDKAQALYNITMIETTKLQAQQTEKVSDAGDKIERVEAMWKNAKLALAEYAAAFVVGIIDSPKQISAMTTELKGADDVLSLLTDSMTGMSDVVKTVGTNSAATATSIHDIAMAKGKDKAATAALIAPYNAQIESLKQQLKARADNEQKIKDEAKAAKTSADDIAKDAKRAGDAYIKAYEDEEKKAEDYYEKVADWQEDQVKQKIKDAKDEGKAIIDAYDDEEKKATKYYDDLFDKMDKEKQAAIDLAGKRLTARESMYKGLTGYDDEYYAARVISIGQQKKDYEDLTGDVVAAAEWEKRELLRLDIDKGISSKSFTDGVLAALTEISTQNQTTWGSTAYDLVKNFSKDSATAFGTTFAGVVTGDMTNIGTAWNSLWTNAVTTLGTKIGEMITQAAADDILLIFNAEWSASASSVLGIIDKVLGLVSGSTLANAEAASVAFDPAIRGYASGGGYEAGKPFWAGEKGPEIIFPSSSGQVLNHEQSMIYAAKNGGHIPGYAQGTGITAMQKIVYDALTGFYSSSSGFGISGAQIDFTMADARIPGYYGMVVLPSGEIVDQRMVKGGTFFSDVLETAAPAIMMAAAAATENYAAASALAAAMISEGQGKGDEAAILNAIIAYAGASYAGRGAAGLGDIATKVGKNIATKEILGLAMAAIFGGGGAGGGISFAGASGDLSWLTSGMGAIAPKTSSFNLNPFSARNGLDYVPYDNFPILAHKGERVQTAREARMGGRASQPIIINTTCPLNGKVFTQYLYDESKAGKKVVHQRGITNV
jgi:hypothetical protein